MHAVHVDDLAPLHDDREALADDHWRDELAGMAIALMDRTDVATKLAAALMLHPCSCNLHPRSAEGLSALHAEIATLNKIASALAAKL